MHITKIDEHIHLIDLELDGLENFIASYVLEGRNTAIVETGPASTVQNLLSSLEELDVKPERVAYVAVSHIHLDHAGAAGALLKHFPTARLVVHRRGAPHVANPEKLWTQAKEALGNIAEMYGKPEPVPEEKIIPAMEGMNFNIGNGVELKVVETLGHASHHLSYYDALSEGIFTGDAAGVYIEKADTIVPTTPTYFRLDSALVSLQKLINLDPRFLYYSHFGKAQNAIEKLQTYINQLRLWAQIAGQAIEKGESHKAVSGRILEIDVAVQKVADLIRNHQILRKTVLNQSVKGVMEFMEKSGNVPVDFSKQ